MPDPCLADAIAQFRKLRALAEGALEQIPPDRWFDVPARGTNSIALTMKHVSGNMRSRWTRFLETDGEKPDRDRDSEFERRTGDDAASIRARWDAGWALLFETLGALGDGDMARTVTVRGEPHTVLQALHRQMTHYAYHVGQIVLLARMYAGAKWKSLSIPRGKSKEYEVGKDGKPYRASRG
jgi:hypothetical protein